MVFIGVSHHLACYAASGGHVLSSVCVVADAGSHARSACKTTPDCDHPRASASVLRFAASASGRRTAICFDFPFIIPVLMKPYRISAGIVQCTYRMGVMHYWVWLSVMHRV